MRVVVVDDQSPFRRTMAAVVAATDGFQVVGQAASGEEAVALCAHLVPDLVLMDVHLPGIDGAEATRQLRRAPTPPAVVLLSTHDADTGEALVAESGAVAYVTKSELGPLRLAATWAGTTG